MNTGRFIKLFAMAAIILLASSNVFAGPNQNISFILIRHAEKPPEGDNLSEKGYKRAEELPKLFQKDANGKQILKTPFAIYAMGQKKVNTSKRAIDTVEPLLRYFKKEGVNVEFNDQYDRNDVNEMVQEIMTTKEYEGQVILICWEHMMIPEIVDRIVKEYGKANITIHDKWPESDFDSIWKLKLQDGEVVKFKKTSEALLPDDPGYCSIPVKQM